ncbi:glycosyltransferase [Pedobacter ginsengisoli]|uniref:glycosyltransferase n=1 Tax=Pedobacter ginsengisoli TaxID=363852 RepID=UPI001FE75F6B|nr:glycosyltransferase [Pedobacter ginsengisoli]
MKKRLRVIEGKEKGLVLIKENLWNLYPDCMVESINWISNASVFNYLNKRNNVKFSYSIKKALEELGFKDFILFNDNELLKGFYLKELLFPALSIYYSRDYILAVDYWKKHGKRLEPLIIAKNDLCLANSLYLTDYCKTYNDNSYYVGQGCDIELFKEAIASDKPAELRGIKTPIVGYVGALNSIRLNIPLIHYIANARKDLTFVLVGPEDNDFAMSGLHHLENVVFTGIKKPEELPLYVGFFDVCINPQLVNMVTIGNYPRKIDEYLAMGKPVVATQTRAMEIFSSYVYLAEDKENFALLIQTALEENTEELQIGRRDFAASHSWENCTNEIYKAIFKSLKMKQS